ncbi:MAG: ArsR family transcriptional regulator [Marinifilaceae bacterium]|jgi:hypothetical protein|nr:ArsR family transcriptional regulator [Marinifilaceae bacterium]
MLESLITSKTRIKLLLKFFLNANTQSYLRSLEQEFGESTNAIRVELNRLEDVGLLKSESEGNRKLFGANIKHPLFNDIHNIIRKHIGIDKIIEEVVEKLGDLNKVYLVGDFARGIDGKIIDLYIIASKIDREYLARLIQKLEIKISRKIRVMVLKPKESKEYLEKEEVMLIWEN